MFWHAKIPMTMTLKIQNFRMLNGMCRGMRKSYTIRFVSSMLIAGLFCVTERENDMTVKRSEGHGE